VNFSWNKLNGGFKEGNPHPPWGMVSDVLISTLEQIATNYATSRESG